MWAAGIFNHRVGLRVVNVEEYILVAHLRELDELANGSKLSFVESTVSRSLVLYPIL